MSVYTDEYGERITKQGLEMIKKDLIEKLNTRGLLEKFYNGTLKIAPGAVEANHIYDLADLKSYPDLIEQAEALMKNGVPGKDYTHYYELLFRGEKLPLKQLIDWDYLGCEEESDWGKVLEREFGGDDIAPPVIKVKTVTKDGRELRSSFTPDYASVTNGYVLEEMKPVCMEISGIGEDGKEYGINIDFSYGDITLSDFSDVKISTILMLSDIDMAKPFISSQVDLSDYYDEEEIMIWDCRGGRADDLYLEVFPFHKKGYKWSDPHDCKKLVSVLNERLKVDSVFDNVKEAEEASIYKLYMNGNIPEILDCFNNEVILQKDKQWFFKVVIDEILALNKNIGVCYFIVCPDFSFRNKVGVKVLKGKYRARKDKNTGEYIITVW